MSFRVKQVLKDWRETLHGASKVTAVGRASSKQKIVVYVERVTPQVLTSIPQEIEGVQVEIRESGRIHMLSLIPPQIIPQSVEPLARTGRVRPMVGGISVGSVQITAGTLGGIAVDNNTGLIVGLSNNHVLLSSDWGDQSGLPQGEIVQPGSYDGGKLPDDLAGYGYRGVPVKLDRDNLVDAAVFKPQVDLTPEILGVSSEPNIVEPEPGMAVVKSGRTTGVTRGEVSVVDATVDVDGWGVARFVDQVMVEPAIMQGGDSGSLVLAEDGRVAGLGFAGSDKISVFSPARNVQNLLNIRILGAVRAVGMVSPLQIFRPTVVGTFLWALAGML